METESKVEFREDGGDDRERLYRRLLELERDRARSLTREIGVRFRGGDGGSAVKPSTQSPLSLLPPGIRAPKHQINHLVQDFAAN